METHTSSSIRSIIAAFALLVGGFVCIQAMRLVWAYSPLLVIAGGAVTVVIARFAFKLWRARLRRTLPAARGLLLGKVDLRRLAKGQSFFLPWDSLLQHVLVAGPTGLGKSTSAIRPLMRELGGSQVGVFYMDGKGAPLKDMREYFDAVFDPSNPTRSARWNPLAGGRPEFAGHRFAEAIYSDVGDGGADRFYIDRGKLAVRHAVIAIAYTGYRGERTRGLRKKVKNELMRLGFSEEEATGYVNESVAKAHRQLFYLPHRRDSSRAGFEAGFRRNSRAPASAPRYEPPFGGGHVISRITPTIADVYRCLFDEASLVSLARHAFQAAEDNAIIATSAAFLTQLSRANNEWRERLLANVEMRLTPFLMPPFDTLCMDDDMRIGEVTNGRKIALLLPQGGDIGGTSESLGQVALALYQSSVLSPRQLRADANYSVAVLDEFPAFLTPNFTKFLAQAREHKAAAVMAVQNISQLRAAGHADDILANASSVIVTSGQVQSDAEYWSKTFGEEEREVQTTRKAKRVSGGFAVDKTVDRTIRTERRPTWSTDEIMFMAPYHMLVRVRLGQKTFRPYLVNAKLDADKQPSFAHKLAGSAWRAAGKVSRVVLNIERTENAKAG